MEKTKKYNNVKFSVDALKEVYTLFCDFVKDDLENIHYRLKVYHDDSKWEYDEAENLNEFYSDYRKYQKDIVFSMRSLKIGVSIYLHME
ncbi:hypothetical protein [Francisella philomiragia]|uniref:Uncharacterized protein n=1 Tax=Francisella philomiragia TaxID=28110 RepID=A0A0B6CZA6_9GAMM|nr:hypothetical protein [Francisella philomiragia]AJI54190.1 hypothetical protein LA55_919 [Francisella philomiragia]